MSVCTLRCSPSPCALPPALQHLGSAASQAEQNTQLQRMSAIQELLMTGRLFKKFCGKSKAKVVDRFVFLSRDGRSAPARAT